MENENTYEILAKKQYTPFTFSLTFPKPNFKFRAGQHVNITFKGEYNGREYSIYSGADEDYLKVLIKEVENGQFTPRLSEYEIGDEVEIYGPYGRFGIDEFKMNEHKFFFIASGTGIAPFHSLVQTYPGMNYELIHGVRWLEERYDHEFYGDKYISCVSREEGGDFHGRITEYLKPLEFEPNDVFYFCGNSEMIIDCIKILHSKGVSRDNMFTEVYF